MTARPVAPGIHLVQHANVNCHLIEDTDGLTLVDAGLPAVWRPLGHAVRALYPLRHPAALPILGSMVAAGVFAVKGIRATAELTPGEPVPVPGRPVVVPSPGHTHGHCALHLPDRDVLISGDALAATGAGTVLHGHGEPWHSGVASAVEEARRHGPA